MSVKLLDLLTVFGIEIDRGIYLFDSRKEFERWAEDAYIIYPIGEEVDYRACWERFYDHMNEHRVIPCDCPPDTHIVKVIEWLGPEDYPENGYTKIYIKA